MEMIAVGAVVIVISFLAGLYNFYKSITQSRIDKVFGGGFTKTQPRIDKVFGGGFSKTMRNHVICIAGVFIGGVLMVIGAVLMFV